MSLTGEGDNGKWTQRREFAWLLIVDKGEG